MVHRVFVIALGRRLNLIRFPPFGHMFLQVPGIPAQFFRGGEAPKHNTQRERDEKRAEMNRSQLEN